MGKEGTSRRDVGCEVSPSCLTCPLPECKYDNPVAFQTLRLAEDPKRQKVLSLLRQGLSAPEVSQKTGLNQKTIHKRGQRAGINIKRVKPGKKKKGTY